MTADEIRELMARQPERSELTLQWLANQGVVNAQLMFGRRLLRGEGSIKSPAAALAWFERAGKKGSAEGTMLVGRCLEHGWGTLPDIRQAFACYAHAAKHGDRWAQYNVGNMYLDGNGVERDLERAAYWYAQAANQGLARAMNLLARCHEEGWGVMRNTFKANDWYRRSAEAGYFRGQYNWAMALVAADRVEDAALWLQRAAVHATPDVKAAIVSYAAQFEHPAMRAIAGMDG
jgi:TPR repeat protein